MTIEKQIQSVQKKLEATRERTTAVKQKLEKYKNLLKTVTGETENLENELKRLEIEKLSEIINRNGYTTADISAAVEAGEIKKISVPVSETEKNSDHSDTENKTNPEINAKEEANNEIGNS